MNHVFHERCWTCNGIKPCKGPCPTCEPSKPALTVRDIDRTTGVTALAQPIAPPPSKSITQRLDELTTRLVKLEARKPDVPAEEPIDPQQWHELGAWNTTHTVVIAPGAWTRINVMSLVPQTVRRVKVAVDFPTVGTTPWLADDLAELVVVQSIAVGTIEFLGHSGERSGLKVGPKGCSFELPRLRPYDCRNDHLGTKRHPAWTPSVHVIARIFNGAGCTAHCQVSVFGGEALKHDDQY